MSQPFPNRDLEAESQYREAWLAYRQTFDDAEHERLGNVMDSLQEKIADNPKDPRWVAFADSLQLSFWVSSQASAGCCALFDGPYMSEQFLGEGMTLAPGWRRIGHGVQHI